MRRGILIALLVPAVAFGAPKKKRKKKAAPPLVEEKQPEPEVEEPPPTPEPPGTPTIPPGAAKTGTTPTTPPPAAPKPGATPTIPPGPPKAGTMPTIPPGTPKTGTTPAATQPTPPPTAAQPTPGGDRDDEPAREGKAVEVDTLRQEYLALRDELFKSRARANAVASQLYSTRMSIKLTWGSARHYGVKRATIRVDGATVYEDQAGAIASDDGVRWNGYVAPGRHLVTFHVEAAGKDDDSFTSTTESQVVVKAVANKDLVIAAKARDSGDIAYEWKRKEQGNYGLGIDVSVKSVAAEAKK